MSILNRIKFNFQILPDLEHFGIWIPVKYKKTHGIPSLMTFNLNKAKNKVNRSFLEHFHHDFSAKNQYLYRKICYYQQVREQRKCKYILNGTYYPMHLKRSLDEEKIIFRDLFILEKFLNLQGNPRPYVCKDA